MVAAFMAAEAAAFGAVAVVFGAVEADSVAEGLAAEAFAEAVVFVEASAVVFGADSAEASTGASEVRLRVRIWRILAVVGRLSGVLWRIL